MLHANTKILGLIIQLLSAQVDNGITWTYVSRFLLPTLHLFSFGGYLFNGIAGQHCCSEALYRSTDSGFTWNPSSEDLSTQNELYDLTGIGNTLFASGSGWGLFRTTNLGKAWIRDSALQNVSSPYSFGDRILILSDSGVLISFDSGNAWFKSTIGLPKDLTCISSVGNHLFVGKEGSGLYHSFDSAKSWISVFNNISDLDSFPTHMVTYNNTLFV